ncbi:unnamed protein product [Cuscuta campestris]|uniref:2-oxoglutarate-dependent dioxygenase DAO n=1 Tax=Cuscuta campestris TaxID=132261 RepID=A0A484M3J3_9ASTE|nr:unnamed protein product [Cuscuta campestris]
MESNGGGEKAVVAIPTIDLQDFPAQLRKLREACEEWGCCRIVNFDHVLSKSLLPDMKDVVKSLFDLPQEIKARNKHVLPGSGYTTPSLRHPNYEALGIYDMSSLHDVEAFCDALDVSPHQRETIVNYAKGAHALIMEIIDKLCEALGVKGEQDFKDWCCHMRINKYHFTPETIGGPGVLTHTDSAFLTVLQDDECVGGLDVITKSGELVAVDPLPGSIVLNLGDMANLWSNGRLWSVRHRVVCKEASVRFSIASFILGPKKEAFVEPPPELVTPDHPRQYVPASYESLRKLRIDNNMHEGEVLGLVRVDHVHAAAADADEPAQN